MLTKLLKEELNTEFGIFMFYIYSTLRSRKQVWVYETPNLNNHSKPLVRIQFGCSIGIVSRGRNCDCNQQFEEAFKEISKYGNGLLIYLFNDDGRGIGLRRKIKFLNLQNQYNEPPLKTAQRFNIQYEDYSTLDIIPELLKKFGILNSIILLTNSPQKISYLKKIGLKISATKNLKISTNKLEAKAKLELEEKATVLKHKVFHK